ncbi:MAG TPA: hypothetical protein VFQ94_06380 [Gallionella sp.]|nr:hypothetical protein [Gallionella sp.]
MKIKAGSSRDIILPAPAKWPLAVHDVSVPVAVEAVSAQGRSDFCFDG